MPGYYSGRQKALHSSAYPDIQIVAQSGYITEATHCELKKLGVFAIIDKGTDLRKLVAAVEAGDGAEACDKVADGEYALIFIDLHMPLMGGVKAIGAIRARHPESFIVAMTGEADAAERARARRAGAYACLSKPFTVDELKKTVRKMNLIAGQRRRMHAGEQERAEREATRPWHHRLRDYISAHSALPGQRLRMPTPSPFLGRGLG